MNAEEVLSVLGTLQERGLRVWLDGGWGVDALLGEETRLHEDADLVVELVSLSEVFEALGAHGFTIAEDRSPVRVVLRAADGRQVDLHPVTFDSGGTGWQRGAAPDGSDCPYPPDGFTEGRILGHPVPCITAELQSAHHSGYEPRERDRLDMGHLADRYGLHLAAPY
jgi:lincosamide nucleotidyltransferase A/C/D/E